MSFPNASRAGLLVAVCLSACSTAGSAPRDGAASGAPEPERPLAHGSGQPRSAAEPLLRGAVTVPVVTGHPERIPFTGHPGWVDVYAPGESAGLTARVGDDAKFPAPGAAGAAILTLDRIEIPAVIVPGWGGPGGSADVPIQCEYACVPPGYPDAWLAKYAVSTHEYWQTFVARGGHIYGLMAFDGRKVTWWGNKVTASLYKDKPGGPRISFKVPWGTGPDDNPNSNHTDQGFPHVGFRHGDVDLVPGNTYAVRITGYKSHGGQHYELPTFIRPDAGDGYPDGEAWMGDRKRSGDLCLLLFGSVNGQYIENCVRSEEWNVFIPKRPPVKRWGQTFVPHGPSLAGVRFWGNSGGPEPVHCRVQIREDGPDGRKIGPAKTAFSHDMSSTPVLRDLSDWPKDKPLPTDAGAPTIRYPDQPGHLPDHEAYYQLPHDGFQAAFVPDEVPLEPGKTYYIELEFDRPMMMFADGDCYLPGYLYYDGQKIEHESGIQHGDPRGTLLVDIVTYAKKGGGAEEGGR